MKDLHSVSNSWETPQDLFDVLDKGGIYQGINFEGFNFEIDLCANGNNSKCRLYCTDYLNNRYTRTDLPHSLYDDGFIDFSETMKISDRESYVVENLVCFMNPPYSNPKPFIQKAWDDSKYCKIVCLLKFDPSTSWWGIFWDYGTWYTCYECLGEQKFCGLCQGKGKYFCRGPKPGCEVIFFPKRIKFDPSQQLINSGEVWKIDNKWVRQCNKCPEDGVVGFSMGWEGEVIEHKCGCEYDSVSGKYYRQLSCTTFTSCLVIMDHRGL